MKPKTTYPLGEYDTRKARQDSFERTSRGVAGGLVVGVGGFLALMAFTSTDVKWSMILGGVIALVVSAGRK